MKTAPEMINFVHAVETIATANRAHHVDVITVELGATCFVSPYYFYMLFQDAAHNTILEDAQLEFIESDDVYSTTADDVVLCGLEIS